MEEINLLQNKLKDRSEAWDKRNTMVSILGGILVFGVLGAGVLIFVLNQGTKSATTRLKAENAEIQTRLDSNQGDLADAKSFQAQLRNIDVLLKNHLHWSQVFDEVEATIIKRARYVTFNAKSEGKVHVEGIVDSYEELGKLILGLNTSESFANVKLTAVQRSTGQQTGYRFAMDFTIKPDLFSKE